MAEYVSADDYIPDRAHSSQGIMRAIKAAADTGAREVRLSRGSYYLTEFTVIETLSIAHDDGCGDIHTKECHLHLEQLHDITLKGAVTSGGEPATRLIGCHWPQEGEMLKTQYLLPSIIWADGCRNLKLQNLDFSRMPETASAGVITGNQSDVITVEVFEGLPCDDQMAAYCMNRFDLTRGSLLGASVTYGFGFENRFRKTGGRTLELQSSLIAGQVHVGEGLSWHQSGRTDFQLFFGGCTNLSFDNVRIRNTNGFAVLTENCEDIGAHRLVIKPWGAQLFAGPRDGWKIYRCTGRIKLEKCHIEGVRMDGQNIHTNFLTVEEIRDHRTLVCSCKYAPIPLRGGTDLIYYQAVAEQRLKLKDWRVLETHQEAEIQSSDPTAGKVAGQSNRVTRYLLELEQEIPGTLGKGTLLDAMCWLPAEYRCRSSTFCNIAGAGHLLRCRHVLIEDCIYENIMNAGILIGAELDTHREGSHGFDITITGCRFINCGFKPRYGQYGMAGIAVKSQGFDAPLNRNIRITGNHFINCGRGIEIRTAAGVTLKENRFQQVNQTIITENSADVVSD